MNRTLKRPMFRKGGTPNEGIMSGLKEPRQGYDIGGNVITTPELYRQRQRLERKKLLTPEMIDQMYKDQLARAEEDALFGAVEDIGGPGTYAERLEGIAAFGGTPEGEKFFKEPLIKKMEEQRAERKALGIPIPEIKLPKTETPEPEEQPKPKLEPRVDSRSDTETIKDYMDMFKTALAEDPDAVRRQKYLQLAQFGTNLLAQPGGDLTAAVGKAATPALTGLGKIQEREQDIATKAKLLGVEAAMKKMDPTQLQETVEYLMSTGLTREEAIDRAVSGGATKGRTREARRTKLAQGIEGEGISPRQADIISEKIMESDIPNYSYTLLPANPTQKEVGKYFYDKVGNVGKLVVKNGKFGLDDGKK